MELTILGTSSSQPTPYRFCTSQVLQHNQDLYLIDCGEGCQIQLSRFHIKRNQIKAIFISHLHGDHFYGLPGVLTSFMHYDRTTPLRIYGPHGLKEFIATALNVSLAYLSFELSIMEIDPSLPITVFDNGLLEVTSFPLDHNVPTCGYRFTSKSTSRSIIPDQIKKYNLNYEEIRSLKMGTSIINSNGHTITSDIACESLPPNVSYAFVSDTTYSESIIPHIQGVDVLYHETTYLKDMEDKAIARKHSTTHHAATIAHKANVGKLIVGHYSSRYKDITSFEIECKEIFTNSFVGYDGMVIKI